MRYSFAMICLIAYLSSIKGYSIGHEKFCRYWCKTSDDRYYCCPTGKKEGWMEYAWHSFLYPWLWISTNEPPIFYPWWSEVFIEDKDKETTKQCPPLRTECPRSYDWYLPPVLCHHDKDCDQSEKCCHDVCLEHKTCKHGE
ncbi:uncharacterized protein LOC143177134 [Calliopsis andreniformis]|uniref:uncharacterized protein LOC143177134 n=1 Tax=Calliopsis andreniformis TaxID=337506 RepID=UPI003FCD177C